MCLRQEISHVTRRMQIKRPRVQKHIEKNWENDRRNSLFTKSEKAYIYITYLHQILGRLIFHFNGTRLYLPSSSTPYGVARYIGVQEQHLITTLTLCLLIRIKGTYIRQVNLLPFLQIYQQSLPLPLCCRTSLTNNKKSLFLPCFTDF